jgi:hypothetical protein
MTRDMAAHHRLRDRLIEAQAAQIAAERRAQAERKLAAFKPRPRPSGVWLPAWVIYANVAVVVALIVLEMTND